MGQKERIEDLLSQLEQELLFSFTRSSGPGGQHANKASTRVELRFSVTESQFLTPGQKDRIQEHLGNRISSDGILALSVQDERSQAKNRELATARFRELIAACLQEKKKRIPTKPPQASEEKRLTEKKKVSEKKQYRKKPGNGSV